MVEICYGSAVPCRDAAGHLEQDSQAPPEGYCRAHSHQGVHVGCSVEQGAEAAGEEFLVYVHYYEGQQHLDHGQGNVVLVQE